MSDASSEQAEIVNEKPNPETKSILDAKFTRRKFLKGAAVVAAGFVASRIPDIPSQIPWKEKSESKESISYAPSITIVDAAPSVPTEGIIQKEFVSNDEMIRKMLGDDYVSKKQLIQEFGPNYEEKWDEVIEKYPQALVYRLVDQYFNHGEKVTRVMESTLGRSGLQSAGINILPLQKIFDKDSIEFIKDSSGNPGIALNFNPKRIIKLLEGDPNRVINGSFQVGNVELFQKTTKRTDVVAKFIDSEGNTYSISNANDWNNVSSRDAQGNQIPLKLLEGPKIYEVKETSIVIEGAYTKEKAMENLPKLFEVCNAYPDKFFVFAAGNSREDLREAMEKLKDKMPNNLLIVAEWTKGDYGGFGYEGPMEQVYGADIYVNNQQLSHPHGSSFSTPVISAEVDMLLRKGFSFKQAKEAIFKKSDLHTLGLNDRTNPTVRVFNPQLLGDK